MKIIALTRVHQFLEDLKKVLFEQEYFVFEETAQKYVDDLFEDIKTNLPSRRHVPAPPYFDKYGKGLYYSVFKKNRRTQWYVFFRMYKVNGEDVYQIRYIANNHTVAQYL